MLKNGRWIFRWIFKLDIHFGKTGYSKLVPEHTVKRGKKSPKFEVEYRKVALTGQLLSRANWRKVLCTQYLARFLVVLGRGDTPLAGTRGLQEELLAVHGDPHYPTFAFSKILARPASSPLRRSSSSMRALRRPISSAWVAILVMRSATRGSGDCPAADATGTAAGVLSEAPPSVRSMAPSPLRSHSEETPSHFENTSSISNVSRLIHVLSPCGVIPTRFANCALLPLE